MDLDTQGQSGVVKDQLIDMPALSQEQYAYTAPGGTWLAWQNKHSLAGSRNENEVTDLCGSSAMRVQELAVSEFLSPGLFPQFASSGAYRITCSR